MPLRECSWVSKPKFTFWRTGAEREKILGPVKEPAPLHPRRKPERLNDAAPTECNEIIN